MTPSTPTTATPSTFVYTTYIRTTPEQLWSALTDPAFTKRYWDIELATDWKVGSTMVWHHHGAVIDDPEQVVLEYEPYTRLAYTWHSFVPELGATFGFSDELTKTLMDEDRSSVSFDIVDDQPMVKLTVIHTAADPDSTILSMVSNGWPQVLAGLKTLIETGRAPDEPEA